MIALCNSSSYGLYVLVAGGYALLLHMTEELHISVLFHLCIVRVFELIYVTYIRLLLAEDIHCTTVCFLNAIMKHAVNCYCSVLLSSY